MYLQSKQILHLTPNGLIVWTANATVLSSIPASSNIVESERRQLKQFLNNEQTNYDKLAAKIKTENNFLDIINIVLVHNKRKI